MLWHTAPMPIDHDPDTVIYLSFAPDVTAEERGDLATCLQDEAWSVQQGLARQTRSEPSVPVVVCLTLVGTGFGKRLGEVAADRMMTIVKRALSWLRTRRATPPQVRQDPASTSTERNEVVDIIDKSNGLVIRLNGVEPDTTLSVLRILLEHRHNASDTPVTWDGETWN